MANLIRRTGANPGSALPARFSDPFELMRDLMRWDPFAELGAGRTDLSFAPSFEVKETRDAYTFQADLPGIQEENLEISLTANRLTVSGKREEEVRNEEDRF